MATRKNALDLYDAQRKKFEDAQRSAVDAWSLLPEGAHEDAWELLSGTVPTAEFVRQNHPLARFSGPVAKYDPRDPTRNQARRGNRGSLPSLPINRQSGRLIQALEMQDTKVPGALSAKRVGFDRSKAGPSLFVLSPEGTTRMVARGFWAELKRRWRARNRAFRDVFVRGQRKAMGN